MELIQGGLKHLNTIDFCWDDMLISKETYHECSLCMYRREISNTNTSCFYVCIISKAIDSMCNDFDGLSYDTQDPDEIAIYYMNLCMLYHFMNEEE